VSFGSWHPTPIGRTVLICPTASHLWSAGGSNINWSPRKHLFLQSRNVSKLQAGLRFQGGWQRSWSRSAGIVRGVELWWRPTNKGGVKGGKDTGSRPSIAQTPRSTAVVSSTNLPQWKPEETRANPSTPRPSQTRSQVWSSFPLAWWNEQGAALPPVDQAATVLY